MIDHERARRSRVLLEADRLKVQYENGALGVIDISLAVAPGQVVAMVGANGAGKSTTLRAISGFARAEGARVIDGSVRVDEREMTNREPYQYSKAGIHCIPERNKVFANLTVTENLLAIGTLPRKPVRRALLARIEDMFPPLAARRSQPAGRLSGGERQMLAIARGMMAQPRLLAIDEMTLGIHPDVQAVLFEAVRHIAANGTAVIIADENVRLALDLADYCYHIESGQIAFSGLPGEYRASGRFGTTGQASVTAPPARAMPGPEKRARP
jgi:branched-chain amino acid transport system ATP-binding protein